MIKMVVFDMAGTTVNEDNVVYKTLQQAINEQGFSFTLEQVLAEGAGKEKLQAIKSVLAVYAGNSDEQLADTIFARFRILLEQAYATLEVTEQENATSLFHSLRENGVLVVLNTGYQEDTAKELIRKLGWQRGQDYDELITASDVSRNRPYPDMILRAMQQFGISKGTEVVKVGDSTIDIEEGQNAGCALSIGITTGAHTMEQLQSAAATAYIKQAKPTFLFIHFHDVDSVGHTVGHGTPEYYAAIERTDAHVAEILASIREAGMEKNTVVIFTADHGGINKGHGSISMNEMEIPWIVKGPGIQQNHEVKSSIMTFDTAATIASLFRLPIPQVWIGKPITEIFK